MRRALLALAAVATLALAGCGQSPEEALIEAVHETSASADDQGLLAGAGLACEMGGMSQGLWGMALVQVGATNEEASATLPAFRAYCDSL